MDLNIRRENDIHIIEIAGDLDMYNTLHLKDAVTQLVENQISKLILNLEDVRYIDSSGIGTLLFIYNTATKKNIRFFITNVKEQPRKVLELTKLTTFFPFADNEKDAVRKLSDNRI